jgi:hypothetical protein
LQELKGMLLGVVLLSVYGGTPEILWQAAHHMVAA